VDKELERAENRGRPCLHRHRRTRRGAADPQAWKLSG